MNFILGIGGGISAYKSLWLIRLLKKKQHQVKVVLTQSALEFVTPVSVHALSEYPAYTDLWNPPQDNHTKADAQEHNMHHISLAKWADFIIIVPATANRISLLAQGECQDLLSNIILASKAPLAIVPAMNVTMWNNPATQDNISTLKKRDIEIWGPASGIQACGDVGQGRLLEPEEIMQKIQHWIRPIEPSFKHLIITAGATQEPLDPVRYISNHSSGKMGIAIAKIAYQCGIQVTLIHAPIEQNLLQELPSEIKKIAITTAEQMLQQTQTEITKARKQNNPIEVFIGCAAVADYRPTNYNQNKIKKTNDNLLTLQLTENPDIIQSIASNKKDKLPFCAGFALESEELINNAQKKLKNKKLDLIFANPVESMNAEKSTITALWNSQNQVKQQEIPHNDKEQNAIHILELISQRYKELQK